MNSARSFRQPCGVGGEFDNVVYARDEIVGTVKILSSLTITNTVKFPEHSRRCRQRIFST